MPRNSRKSGSQGRKCGISKEQVCAVGAIDSYDNIVLNVVGLGPASTAMIEKALNGKIESGSTLILKQVPVGYHKIEHYDLGEINSLFNELENFVRNFNGLSTIHRLVSMFKNYEVYSQIFRARRKLVRIYYISKKVIWYLEMYVK